MTAQEYIQSKLTSLQQPSQLPTPATSEELVEVLFRSLTSKKFRKFSMSDELKAHVREAIKLNVKNNDPINITFLHGAYKLWRLDESPEVDWAELFALMRYIAWLKPLCELYKPGVILDFFVDDYIVPLLNNVEMSDVEAYLASYQSLMDFLTDYAPKNLKLTITTVGSQFASKEAFEASVYKNLQKIEEEQHDQLPELSPQIRAMIELNAKPTPEQLADRHWQEKVWNLHNGYSITKAEPGYHKDRPEKILAFTSSLPMAIGVGTTKKAIMKFWIGAGVLERDGTDFNQDILSPAQLEKADFDWQDIELNKLSGKNFKRVRILN